LSIRRLAGSATREPACRIIRLDEKIVKFPQSVLHRQHGFCIVQVDNRFERYARRHCCVNVGQAKRRVVSHEMAATTRAELSVTHFRFGGRRIPFRGATKRAKVIEHQVNGDIKGWGRNTPH